MVAIHIGIWHDDGDDEKGGQWAVLSALIDNIGVTDFAWKTHTTLDCIYTLSILYLSFISSH